MRLSIRFLLLASLSGAVFGPPLAQAANLPLCLAIAENYNKCMRQHQRGWGGGYPGYGPGAQYGGGRYGGGYGGYGGYEDDDDGPGGGYYGRQRRSARAQSACAIWFAQMQASGCFN